MQGAMFVVMIMVGALFALVADASQPPRETKAGPDVKAAEAAIMQADRDFNRAVAEGSRERFAALIAPNATFNGGSPAEARGREAIVKSWEPFFAAGGPRLSWEPTLAHVLVGGDVGITIGSWIRRAPDANGQVVERRGQYLTTWARQDDGRWLVVADLGSTAP
jgi:uncharacterized protein (TIGR02246 family)